jgi:hypothetical protein
VQLLSVPQRQWRIAVASLVLLAAGAAPLILRLGDVPLCAFKHLTGVPCPLCGGIRACAALAQGDVAAAFQVNPGLMPLLFLAALHGGLLLAEAASGRQLAPPRALHLAWKVAGGVLVASWLWRLAGLL